MATSIMSETGNSRNMFTLFVRQKCTETKDMKS